VLWDLDGTLVNSEPYWMAAEAELVAEHGGQWSYEDGVRLVGRPLLEAAGLIAAHGVDLEPSAIVERLVGDVSRRLREAVPWQPGALELLTALRDAGVPCALVTMSYRVLADAVTSAAAPGLFAAVVCGDEVTHGKPHPEPYLRAAQLLSVDIERCVAVEDSRPGIGSALTSGARTIGVQVVVPVEPAPGLSRVASLEQLDLDAVRSVASGRVLDLLGA
jgi:HAD superfamily hydrolase (TIGR01509 family)